MALVDYSSDSEAEPEADAPKLQDSPEDLSRRNRVVVAASVVAAAAATEEAPAQKQIPENTLLTPAAAPAPALRSAPALPPLPSAFHDLYASTVRTSTVDDPSLHQGRTRQIPHVAGNWPSHIYIEWFPAAQEHDLLSSLLSSLRGEIRDSAALHTFLTSDLGAPLPLHISLSRPFVLRTEEKDNFLREFTEVIRNGPITPFTVSPTALDWHRSPDSNRAFLVLRVQSATGGNTELSALLDRSNKLITAAGQPALYAGREVGAAAEAFHISIAWSFAEDLAALDGPTAVVYGADEHRRPIESISIPIDGVKAKIGNVVTHIALPEKGRRTSLPKGRRGNLFGL